MRDKTAQLFAVVVGLALIAVYSIVMIATNGGAGWAWLLLIAGIIVLIGGGRLFRDRATT